MKNPDFTRQFLVVICFIIIILIILLFLYNNSTKNLIDISDSIIDKLNKEKKYVQKDIMPLFNDFEEKIRYENILNDNLIESYIFYIYFENLYGNELWLSNFHSPKNIMRRENNGVSVSYKPDTNQLLINIPIKRLGIYSKNNDEEKIDLKNSKETIIVNGIKIQKWLQIALIINGRDVDIYIDKKLKKNQLLDNVPILSNNDIIIGEQYKNPNCYIGRIEYSTLPVSIGDLNALYIKNMRKFSVETSLRNSIYFKNQEIKESIYSPS
tara:strand:+ start:44 stop:847 length:804 start_codon:yes stop_codon:yes gene_type:complete